MGLPSSRGTTSGSSGNKKPRYIVSPLIAKQLSIPTQLPPPSAGADNVQMRQEAAAVQKGIAEAAPMHMTAAGELFHAAWLESAAQHLAQLVAPEVPQHSTNNGLFLVHNLIDRSFFNPSIVTADNALRARNKKKSESGETSKNDGGLSAEQLASAHQLLQAVSIRDSDVSIGKDVHDVSLKTLQVARPTLVDGIRHFPGMFSPLRAVLVNEHGNKQKGGSDDASFDGNKQPTDEELHRRLLFESSATFSARIENAKKAGGGEGGTSTALSNLRALNLCAPPATAAAHGEQSFYGLLGTVSNLAGFNAATRLCQRLVMDTFTKGFEVHCIDVLDGHGLAEKPTEQLAGYDVKPPRHFRVMLPTYLPSKDAFQEMSYVAPEKAFGLADKLAEAAHKTSAGRKKARDPKPVGESEIVGF